LAGDYTSSAGWVKLHRQINDCAALQGPACQKWAWADLMLLAAHKPVSVVVDLGDAGRLRVDLLRGEFCLGYRFLCHRWQWGIASVHRFITKLIREDMLTWRPAKGLLLHSQADLFDSLLTGDARPEKGANSGTGYRNRVPLVHCIANYDTYQHNSADLGTAYRNSSSQEVLFTSDVIYNNTKTKTKKILELSSSELPNIALLRELGELWNSLPGLIHHGRPALRAFDRKLAKALAVFGPDLLKLAFQRYSAWRCNSQGRYRQAYSWTLGEFVSRSDGSHVARLSSDAWEAGCLPFGNETQEQANTRARARAAASAGDGEKADKTEGPAWLRWGRGS
jgi:hypothetical protein